MDNQKVIATLNNLLETTQDGVRGFVACAEGVTNPRLKMVFEAAARRCDEGAAELKAKIRSLGGEPATSGTGLDQYYLVDYRDGQTCGRRCRKRAYEAALDEALPTDVEAIVRRQYQGVKENHDRIRDLRNQAAHASS